MAAIEQLLKNSVDTARYTLPLEIIKPTKMQILDALGAAVANRSFGTIPSHC
jgi:hypothetical protein